MHLLARLASRASRIVSYPDWDTMDAAEKRRRPLLGKPCEKFVT
jgi:ferredoxin/flavodoxin---NADP+ reductase